MVSYTTNAKVYPVAKIVSGVVDICYNRPFEIPALESLAVNPDVLDKYVGVLFQPLRPQEMDRHEGRRDAPHAAGQ